MKLRVSPSQLATFRQCPLKWKLAYLDGWRSPDKATHTPAGIGTLWSELMEIHYTSGDVDSWVADKAAVDSEISDEIWSLLDWMYTGYVTYWGDDPNWEVVEAEQEHLVEFENFNLLIKPDLVVRDRISGELLVVDHKTLETPLNQRQIDLDDQFGLYVLALREAGLPVQAAVFNGAIRKQLKTKEHPLNIRFARNTTYRGRTELKSIFEDMTAVTDAMLRIIRGESVPYSAPDHRSCGWKCDFLESHLVLRKTDQKTMNGYLEASGFTRKDEEVA